MRKKVGILTLHRAHNVGAALQVFALTKEINSLGHNCEVIDYWPEASMGDLRQLSLMRRINSRIQTVFFRQQRKRVKDEFNKFQNELPLTGKTLRTEEEVKNAHLDHDVFICGSDQIWNPMSLPWGVSGPYFLSFVGEGEAMRSSYAASIGVTELNVDGEREKWMAEKIRKMDWISVRERSGVGLVRELTGRVAEHVLDPTLLVSPKLYKEIAEAPRIDEPYLLVYATQYPRQQNHMQLLRRIAQKRGLKIIVFARIGAHPQWFFQGGRIMFGVGPKQFVGLIENASCVVTTSFHGTAMSIALKKDFWVIPHSAYNTRMESLLSILGLEERQLAVDASAKDVNSYMGTINYKAVEPLLEEERQKSKIFLQKAIEG